MRFTPPSVPPLLQRQAAWTLSDPTSSAHLNAKPYFARFPCGSASSVLCSCMHEIRRSCPLSRFPTDPCWLDFSRSANTSRMPGRSIASRSGPMLGTKDMAPVYSPMLKPGSGSAGFGSCRSRPSQQRAKTLSTRKRENSIAAADSRRSKSFRRYGMLITRHSSLSRSCMRGNASPSADFLHAMRKKVPPACQADRMQHTHPPNCSCRGTLEG